MAAEHQFDNSFGSCSSHRDTREENFSVICWPKNQRDFGCTLKVCTNSASCIVVASNTQKQTRNKHVERKQRIYVDVTRARLFVGQSIGIPLLRRVVIINRDLRHLSGDFDKEQEAI